MNEVRRARIKCDIEMLACICERIDKIRDDEDRALRGETPHGPGSKEAADMLTEATYILLKAINQLQKARGCLTTKSH
jgi:hypothetical protein